MTFSSTTKKKKEGTPMDEEKDIYKEFMGSEEPEKVVIEENKEDLTPEQEPKKEEDKLAFFEIQHNKEQDTYTMSAETFNAIMEKFRV